MQKEIRNLDWFEITEALKKNATSEIARQEIEQISALKTPELAHKSFAQTLEVKNILLMGTRPFMESLDFFDAWYSRLKINARLKNIEFKDVRKFCYEVLALREVTQNIHTTWIESIHQQLMNAEEPLSAIDQIFSANGEIRIDASENLYRLFREKDNCNHQIQTNLDRLVKSYDVEAYLQDKYVTTREGRWVVPIKSGKQSQLPGIIHGSSQSKQTVFIEPDTVVPINNRIRQIEVEIEEEIEKLIKQLSDYLYSIHTDFEKSKQLLVLVDIKLAQAKLSMDLNASIPEFNETVIQLKEVKHPLLLIKGEKVVANTVELDQEKRILILTGPNAGGKTVLLKSIGLACHMARCGLLICADEGSTLPFFQNLVVGIGDSQSVDAHLSTFAAHLKILHQSSELKGSHNLILVDEICGSTDPEEGAALARSFIEKFSSNKVFAIVTSHLSPLKGGWNETHAVLNGSLEYNAKTGRPTYQFLAGIPGDSLAIQTAKRVGVPTEIIERAIEFLRPEMKARILGLDEIETLKNDLNLLKEKYRKDNNEAQNSKKKYDELLEQLKKEKDIWLEKEIKIAQKKIDEMISHAKVEEAFKKHTTLQEIKKELPQIVKASNQAAPAGQVQTGKEFSQRYPPGTKIFVPSLNQDGIVQSEVNGKGEVQILSGSLRISLPWNELKPPGQFQNPTAQLVRKSSPFTIALHDADRSLDLRGKKVEDALEELELALDNAARHQEDRIKIIHGHGTEAVKKAVRAYLSRSVYVSKWKAGTPENGGDGITWAEIMNDGYK